MVRKRLKLNTLNGWMRTSERRPKVKATTAFRANAIQQVYHFRARTSLNISSVVELVCPQEPRNGASVELMIWSKHWNALHHNCASCKTILRRQACLMRKSWNNH